MTRKKKQPDDEPDKPQIEVRTIWTNPRPQSAMMLAVNALDQHGNAITARAVRALAKAEANGGLDGTALDLIEVANWLRKTIGDIEWLIDHIESGRFDSQRDIPALVPELKRKVCAWVECGRWFVVERSTGQYCSQACKQKAYRARKRAGEQ